MENKWIVYLLKSSVSDRTYIGATNNFNRRLKQHNGKIKGGAKYTQSNRPWNVVLTISGLPNKISALCLEWRIKRNAKMKTVSGLKKRIYNIYKVLNMERFTSKCDPTSTIKLINITFFNNYFSEEYCLLNDRENILVTEI